MVLLFGRGGRVVFCCLGGGRVLFFAVWAGACSFFAVWAGVCSFFLLFGPGACLFVLLFGRGTGVHSLTRLPGSSLSDPTTKETEQQKKKHGFPFRSSVLRFSRLYPIKVGCPGSRYRKVTKYPNSYAGLPESVS